MTRTRRTGAALVAAATLATTLSALPTGASAAPGTGPQDRPTAAAAKDDARTRAAKAAVATPRITWTRCGTGVQCGEMQVPLDYGDPSLGTITVPLSRRPADKEGKRIGAIFTNPGGPGGPATMTAPYLAEALGPQVKARFDVVGVGPRGVEGEELAVCEGRIGEQVPTVDFHAFPTTPAEMKQQQAFDQAYRRTCKTDEPRILDHMSTADTARDMDLARRALGDEQLTYYGISYGSVLGETYAAMYPDKVRALVVDGVLDPVAWTTGRGREAKAMPVTERILSHQGAEEAMMAAIAECERVGTSRCPEAKTIRQDWAVLLKTLPKHPIDLGDGMVLRYDDVVAMALGILYSPDDIPMLVTTVHELRESVAPSTPAPAPGQVTIQGGSQATAQSVPGPDPAKARAVGKRLRRLAQDVDRKHPAPAPIDLISSPRQVEPSSGDRSRTGRAPQVSPTTPRPAPGTRGATSTKGGSTTADPGTPEPPEEQLPPTYDASFHGVLCADSVNPTTFSAWTSAHRRVDKEAPGFGPAWLWSSSPCLGWPGSSADAYRGPFTKRTSTPVMIIGNSHDPATPLSGAQAYRRLMKGSSRLVTLQGGFGHGALGVSRCVDKVRTAYLVNQTVPAGDVTCAPDHEVFTRLD